MNLVSPGQEELNLAGEEGVQLVNLEDLLHSDRHIDSSFNYLSICLHLTSIIDTIQGWTFETSTGANSVLYVGANSTISQFSSSVLETERIKWPEKMCFHLSLGQSIILLHRRIIGTHSPSPFSEQQWAVYKKCDLAAAPHVNSLSLHEVKTSSRLKFPSFL